MESRVEINISRKKRDYTGREHYSHFFRVEVKGHHLLSKDPNFKPAKDFQEVLESLMNSYPAPEFKITVTEWSCTGKDVAL